MKPSRIIKSAWKRAGKPTALKLFAMRIANPDAVDDSPEHAAAVWLRNKKSK